MRIAVCEDQKAQRSQLMEKIRNWSVQNATPIAQSEYANAENFLFHNETDGPFDCIFIDINLGKGENGLELAQNIRKTNSKVAIVFTTAIPDYVFSGYKVNAVDYLIKPVKEADLDRVLRYVRDALMDFRDDTLLIKSASERKHVHFDKILYVESLLHHVAVHTTKGIEQFRGSLMTMEERLPEDLFVRTHRSFIVNLMHISTANRNTVTLKNGKQIPVGRRYWRSVDSRLFACFGNAPNTPKKATVSKAYTG